MNEIYYTYGKDIHGKDYYYVRVNGLMYAQGENPNELWVVLNAIKRVFEIADKPYETVFGHD